MTAPILDRSATAAPLDGAPLDGAPLDGARTASVTPLPSPALLRHELPAGPAAADAVRRGRAAAVDVLHGDDDRLLVVVGPCSIHDDDAARE